MSDQDVRIGIGFETDDSSVAKAKKAVTTMVGTLQEIERSKALVKLAEDAARQAKSTNDSAKAVERLNAELKKTGATEAEIKKVARAYEVLGTAIDKDAEAAKRLADASSFENRYKKLSDSVDPAGQATSGFSALSGAASQFGATGLGDAAGAAAGITDLIENLPRLKASVLELPSTVKAAAGAIGFEGLAIGAALAAIALAFAEFNRQAEEQAEQLRNTFEARRSVLDEIVGGATSEDIDGQIEKLQFRRELEAQVLADSQQAYTDFIEGIREQFGFLAPLVEGFVKVFDAREEELANQVKESTDIIDEATQKEKAYKSALEQGLTAKADAKQAQEDLAKAQEKAAQEAERAAEKQKREAERAAQEVARAAEKAANEARQAAERAAAAQTKYTQSVQDANRSFGQATQDIAKKAKQTSADLTKSLGRDLLDGQTKYDRDVYNLQLKTQRDDVKRLKDHARNLDSIRDEAFKSEEDARKSRNFLQIQDIRANQKAQANAALRELDHAREDAGDEYKAQRTDQKQALDYQQQDRRLALTRQRQDQAEAIKREFEQAVTAKKRNIETAGIAYQREQQQLAQHLTAMGNLRIQSYNQEAQMAAGGRPSTGGFNGAAPGPGGRVVGIPVLGAASSVTNNRNDNSRRNVTINTNNDAQLARILREAGY
jgi:hypothetical protein